MRNYLSTGTLDDSIIYSPRIDQKVQVRVVQDTGMREHSNIHVAPETNVQTDKFNWTILDAAIIEDFLIHSEDGSDSYTDIRAEGHKKKSLVRSKCKLKEFSLGKHKQVRDQEWIKCVSTLLERSWPTGFYSTGLKSLSIKRINKVREVNFYIAARVSRLRVWLQGTALYDLPFACFAGLACIVLKGGE